MCENCRDRSGFLAEGSDKTVPEKREVQGFRHPLDPPKGSDQEELRTRCGLSRAVKVHEPRGCSTGHHSFVLALDNNNSFENAGVIIERINSITISPEALLSGHVNRDAVVLSSIGTRSHNGSGFYILDRDQSSENDLGRAVSETSSSESLADDLTVWEESGSMVGRGGA